MSYSIRFPWDKTERGQGFFIPCLDTAKVRLQLQGASAAPKYK